MPSEIEDSPFQTAQNTYVGNLRTSFLSGGRRSLASATGQLHHVLRVWLTLNDAHTGIGDSSGQRMLAWLHSIGAYNLNDIGLNGLALPSTSAAAAQQGGALHLGNHIEAYDDLLISELTRVADEFGDVFTDEARFHQLFVTGQVDGVDVEALRLGYA